MRCKLFTAKTTLECFYFTASWHAVTFSDAIDCTAVTFDIVVAYIITRIKQQMINPTH